MKTIANIATSKAKIILIILLIFPLYTDISAQPFVSVSKNGTSASLSIPAFESGAVYQEVTGSSTGSISQELWATIPVLISFSLLMFFVVQFSIQLIRDRKLAKE